MALQTDLTSDEELSTTIDLSDAQAIRKQLDGLENMYTEVGGTIHSKSISFSTLRRIPGVEAAGTAKVRAAPRCWRGRGCQVRDRAAEDVREHVLAAERVQHRQQAPLQQDCAGGASSARVTGVNCACVQEKKREERGGHRGRGLGKDKNYTKRFQRLESHVVTLARYRGDCGVRDDHVLHPQVGGAPLLGDEDPARHRAGDGADQTGDPADQTKQVHRRERGSKIVQLHGMSTNLSQCSAILY